MKLRTKIQLIFGGTAILLMSLMGSVAYSLSYQAQMQMVQTDVNRASALASENLSNQLQNYMNVTSISGTDSIIRDSSASISDKEACIDRYVQTYGFTSGNLLRRVKALIPVLVPLLLSSFRRADELAVAMAYDQQYS